MENIIYGIRPVIEALKEGRNTDKILIQKGLTGDNYGRLFKYIRDKNIHHQLVPAEKLNKITKNNHQGVIAYIAQIDYWKVEDVITKAWDSGETPLLVILDGITDVRNFGAIARTVECAGAHGIIIPAKGSVTVNDVSVKTSAGALNRVPVCKEDNLLETISFIKECGLKVVATSERSNNDIYNSELKEPMAVIFGSEDRGVSKACLKLADKSVFVPMSGETGSLNVSVATGVVLFEINRQRKYK